MVIEDIPVAIKPIQMVDFGESEVVIGLVGAVGTDMKVIIDKIKENLPRPYRQNVQVIKISSEIIESDFDVVRDSEKGFERINALMDAGDSIRKRSNDCGMLVNGVVRIINTQRIIDEQGKRCVVPKKVYIIDSLKHPDEVVRLRQIYRHGFFLIGVYSKNERRIDYLYGLRDLMQPV